MNAQTWLTKLTITAAKADERRVLGIKLYGFSLSNDELGNFLTRLSDDLLFENVVLKYAKENQSAKLSKGRKAPVKVIQFQIDLNVSNVGL